MTTFPFSMLDSEAREKILTTMTKETVRKDDEIVGLGETQKFCYVVAQHKIFVQISGTNPQKSTLVMKHGVRIGKNYCVHLEGV